ncbi:hypothetical protein S83_008174 [Arachis hypogaea]
MNPIIHLVPFISPPLPAGSYSTRHSDSPAPMLSTKTEADVDLQDDVLAASHAATKTAEGAIAAARSAASLAQVRISEQSPDSSSL